jgi:tetratricopeptide (TPR) repeat protein
VTETLSTSPSTLFGTTTNFSGIISTLRTGELNDNDIQVQLNRKQRAKDSTEPTDFFDRGIDAWIFGDCQQAILFFKQVLELESNTSEAANNIACCLMEMKDFNAAIDHFNLAIELNPEYHQAIRSKAMCQYALNKFDLALACLNRAIDIARDPSSYDRIWRYYNLRGLVLDKMDRFGEALLQFDISIKFLREQAGISIVKTVDSSSSPQTS